MFLKIHVGVWMCFFYLRIRIVSIYLEMSFTQVRSSQDQHLFSAVCNERMFLVTVLMCTSLQLCVSSRTPRLGMCTFPFSLATHSISKMPASATPVNSILFSQTISQDSFYMWPKSVDWSSWSVCPFGCVLIFLDILINEISFLRALPCFFLSAGITKKTCFFNEKTSWHLYASTRSKLGGGWKISNLTNIFNWLETTN